MISTLTAKHGKPYITRVDKNGTEYWTDPNCPKCGGTGYIRGYEFSDGARCWKCGATGFYPHHWIQRTPEYAAKLEAKRIAKARKENIENRQTFLTNNGFNTDGITFVVTGKTFEIKEELKAVGAKYSSKLGWHFSEKPESFTCVEITIADCFWENDVSALIWNDRFDIQSLVKERTPHEPSKSEYLGEVGKRLTADVILKMSFSFENNYASRYYTTTTYIHSFEDKTGNAIVWKTTTPLHENKAYKLVGTVKEHNEYKGTKQTILTRCKFESSNDKTY